MNYNTNRPTYLKRKLQEFQDKSYARQPQLMEKLNPFIDKAESIQNNSEPVLASPQDPLSKTLNIEPQLNGKLSKPTISKKRKISDIKRKTLWALK